MKKRFLSLVMVLSIIAIGFTFFTVKANSAPKRRNFVETQIRNDFLDHSTNIVELINEKKAEFENSLTTNGLSGDLNSNIDYNSLFSTEGQYKYAEITTVSQPSSINIDETVYQEYNVCYTTHNVNVLGENQALVRYLANNGQYVTTVIVDLGTQYQLQENQFPLPQGRDFAAWDVENVGRRNPGDTINITGNVDIVAVWTEFDYGDNQPIDTLNISVERPKIGDSVNVVRERDEENDFEYDLPTLFPNAAVENANCDIEFPHYIKGFPSMMEDFDTFFTGTFEEGQYYYIELRLLAKEGFAFAGNDDMTITVNGENANYEKGEYNQEGYQEYLVYVKVLATEEDDKTEEYTLNSGEFTVMFKDIPNHHYQLFIEDVLSLTPEERERYEIPEEEFNTLLEKVKETVKEYGDLLRIYAINIREGGNAYEGKATIKIKYTDELKKYNTFKFVYLDENNKFKITDIVNLRVEGDYIVGEVPHFSAYALTGTYVDNPKTNDNIILYVSLLGISLLGIVGVSIYSKKKTSK